MALPIKPLYGYTLCVFAIIISEIRDTDDSLKLQKVIDRLEFRARNEISASQMQNKRAKMALYCSPDYQINWPFGSGEMQNRFSKIEAMAPSWISDLNEFSSFLSTSHPDVSYQVWSQLAFRLRRRSEK